MCYIFFVFNLLPDQLCFKLRKKILQLHYNVLIFFKEKMLFLNFCTIPEPEQIITQSLFTHEDIMYSQNTLVKSQRLQILPLLPSNLYLGTTSNNEFMRGLRFKLYLWLWYCEINILFSEDVNDLWTYEWQHGNQQFKVWWSLLEKFHFRTSPVKYLLWELL